MLFCVLLPFVGTTLDSLAPPKLDKTSFLTNESGLGSFHSNLRKIALIPSLSVFSSRSTCSRSWMMLGLVFIQPVAATNCPFCFGNIPTCTFGAASGASCPAEVVPRENAAIITGSATGSLKLAGCLAPRFLRILTFFSWARAAGENVGLVTVSNEIYNDKARDCSGTYSTHGPHKQHSTSHAGAQDMV